MKDQDLILYLKRRRANAFVFTYVDMPTPPAFSGTAVTLNPATMGPSIEPGEITTSGTVRREILVPEPYTQPLWANGWVWSSGAPWKVKSLSDSVRSWIGGDVMTTGQQIFDVLNNSNYIELHHLGFKGDSNPSVAGISGITFRPQNPATRVAVLKAYDLIIKDTSASGIQINSGVAGSVYSEIVLYMVRIFGYELPDSQEIIYIGNTDPANNGESQIVQSSYEHVVGVGKRREGFQINNNLSFSARKMTFVDVGMGSTAGQKHLLQIQNCNGVIADCIFYCRNGTADLWNIFAHGVTIRNCYFYFTGAGYWGRMSDATQFNSSPAKNSAPCYIEDCDFVAAVPLTYIMDIREDECDITFTNCRKNSNGANLYADNRVDKVTYTLSQVGTAVQETPAPTFVSLDVNDEENHGKLNDFYHYPLGRGYRTPDV